jgi:hypothetical protein
MCVYELPINKIFIESEENANELNIRKNENRIKIIGFNMGFVFIR